MGIKNDPVTIGELNAIAVHALTPWLNGFTYPHKICGYLFSEDTAATLY